MLQRLLLALCLVGLMASLTHQAKIYYKSSLAIGMTNDVMLGLPANMTNTASMSGGCTDPTNGDSIFVDTSANRVYRVGSDGMVILVAGNGFSGYNGEYLPANTSQLNGMFVVSSFALQHLDRPLDLCFQYERRHVSQRKSRKQS